MTTITVDIEQIDINMLSTTISFLTNIFEQRKQKSLKTDAGFTAQPVNNFLEQSHPVDNPCAVTADILDPTDQLPIFESVYEVAPLIDSDGAEWDERLHHAGKLKTKNGKWKLKAGMKPASARLVADTESSIEQLKNTDSLALQLQVEIPPPHPLHAADVDAYNKLLRKITEHIRAENITSSMIEIFYSSLGVQSLKDVKHDLSKIAELSRMIDEAAAIGEM